MSFPILKIRAVHCWNEAHATVPHYNELHNWVAARAGEGEEVTREDLNLPTRHFTFPELLAIELPSGTYAVYSIDRATGEFDVELVS